MTNDLMTPSDHYADALLRFENWSRYCAQSEATEAGRRAECPERERLSRELRPDEALA